MASNILFNCDFEQTLERCNLKLYSWVRLGWVVFAALSEFPKRLTSRSLGKFKYILSFKNFKTRNANFLKF